MFSDSFVGFPAYLAPEMLLNKPHSVFLDIYMLGVLIYEMVDGSSPFYTNNK